MTVRGRDDGRSPEGAHVIELKAFPDRELLAGYLQEAVWFWFDASTLDKKLEVGLHRLVARCIFEEIRERGLDEPQPDRVYAHARRRFPPDDLHSRNRHDYWCQLDISPRPEW
jgi:hypothetical protein